MQRYRAQATYTPRAWLNVGANFNVVEQKNNTSDIAYRMHNRNFGFNAVAAPKEGFSFDLAYNYSAYLQNSNICYIGTAAARLPASTTMPCLKFSAITTTTRISGSSAYRSSLYSGSLHGSDIASPT